MALSGRGWGWLGCILKGEGSGYVEGKEQSKDEVSVKLERGSGCLGKIWESLSDKKGRRRRIHLRGKGGPFYTHRRRVFCPREREDSSLIISLMAGAGRMVDAVWTSPSSLHPPPSPLDPQSQPPFWSFRPVLSANSPLPSP